MMTELTSMQGEKTLKTSKEDVKFLLILVAKNAKIHGAGAVILNVVITGQILEGNVHLEEELEIKENPKSLVEIMSVRSKR